MTRFRTRTIVEFVIEKGLFFCAAGSILVTAGIIFVLLFETVEFLREVPIRELPRLSGPKPLRVQITAEWKLPS